MRKIFAWLIGCSLVLWLVPHSLGQWISPNGSPSSRPTVPMVFVEEQEYRLQLIQNLISDYNRRLDAPTQHRIVQEIFEASETTDLDPFLVTAVIAAESSFRPNAVSPCGARGLMQLTRIVQPSLGVTNPFDIAQNIKGGCTFLAELHKRFGDTTLALAAYNAGPTRVARLGRVPRIRETQRYVIKVQRIATFLFEQLLNGVNAYRPDPVSFLNRLTEPAAAKILHDGVDQYRPMIEPMLSANSRISSTVGQLGIITTASLSSTLSLNSGIHPLWGIKPAKNRSSGKFFS